MPVTRLLGLVDAEGAIKEARRGGVVEGRLVFGVGFRRFMTGVGVYFLLILVKGPFR